MIGLPTSRKATESGTSFVELLVAVAMIGIGLLVAVQQIGISIRESHANEDILFANQKAMSLLAELQNAIDAGVITSGDSLAAFDDVLVPNAVLTTRLDEMGSTLNPDHVMSGNETLADALTWKWTRVITVDQLSGDERSRFVRIQLLREDVQGNARTVARIGGVLNLPHAAAPSTKTYDVYMLAIANVTSQLGTIEDMRAQFESVISTLAAKNPGLNFRPHWITKLGYGRDPYYTPFINESSTTDLATGRAYWYPGTTTTTGRVYRSDNVHGKIRTEGGPLNGFDATFNPLPYTLADSFNHCMRLPAARELHESRVAAGLENADEPPLQILLADMAEGKVNYRNAVFMNLHGETLPVPPMRNYSDAARSPTSHPNVRVVTHPARQQTPRDPNADGNHSDSEDLELRVYAYSTDPVGTAPRLSDCIAVRIDGVDLSQNVNGAGVGATTLRIRRLVGGVPGTLGTTYRGFDSPDGVPAVGTTTPVNEMRYDVVYDAASNATIIRLFDTPLTSPVVGTGGLAIGDRLYGLEYIPSPVVSTGFDRDLASVSATAKNSARWRIRVPKDVFSPAFPGGGILDTDQRIDVTTWIDDTGTAVIPLGTSPANQTTTYGWWAAAATAVPLTERFQILGDPRHSPYVDSGSAGNTVFQNGYNPFFTDLIATTNTQSDWTVFDSSRLSDKFPTGTDIDVPRAMQVWREAMLGSGTVFIHGFGPLAGRLALGGEVLAPGDFSTSGPMPVSMGAGFYGGLTTTNVCDVRPDAMGVNPGYGTPVVHHTLTSFWAKPWLGELCPDSDWAQWITEGNLPLGLAGYRRTRMETFTSSSIPSDTSFARSNGRMLDDLGAPTLIWDGNATKGLAHHILPSAAYTIFRTPAVDFAAAAGIGLPDAMPCRYPFDVNVVLSQSLPQQSWTTTMPACTVTVSEVLGSVAFGAGQTAHGAGVVTIEQGGDAASFLLVADSPSTYAQVPAWGREVSLFAIRAFMTSGMPAGPTAVEQVPIVKVTSPGIGQVLLNPTTVVVRWQSQYRRFDGEDYTEAYPGNFNGAEVDLRYVLLYSKDGDPYRHLQDSSLATPGVMPTNPALVLADGGLGDESFIAPLPALMFPAGNYAFRVECYLDGRVLHMTEHEVSAKIDR